MPQLSDAYLYHLVRWVKDQLAELAIVLGLLTLVSCLVLWTIAAVVPLVLCVLGGLLVVGGLLVHNSDVPAPGDAPADTSRRPAEPSAG